MLGLLLRVLLDARLASHLGAALAGHPELGAVLEHVAVRESRLELVGVHEGDRHHERTLGVGWSTRGVHGMMARYAYPYVPGWLRWAMPELLDVPLASALIGARRAASWRCRATAACRAWVGYTDLRR